VRGRLGALDAPGGAAYLARHDPSPPGARTVTPAFPSRRAFVRRLGFAAGLAPLLRWPGFPGPHRLGLQLYTVREAAQADLGGTLAALASFGYAEVEFAGLYGHPAPAVRDMLRHAGLDAPAGHVSLEDLEERFGEVVTTARALGHRWVIVPWLDPRWRSAAGYQAAAGALNRLGRALGDQGLGLGYHNHQFEFAALPEGGTGFERLLGETAPDLVTFELDLFWAADGGADSLELFRRHRDRFRMVHVKDRAPDGRQVTVGRGTLDWPVLLAAARRAGVRHWFIEQDDATDPLAFARESWEHLSRVAW